MTLPRILVGNKRLSLQNSCWTDNNNARTIFWQMNLWNEPPFWKWLRKMAMQRFKQWVKFEKKIHRQWLFNRHAQTLTPVQCTVYTCAYDGWGLCVCVCVCDRNNKQVGQVYIFNHWLANSWHHAQQSDYPRDFGWRMYWTSKKSNVY